jgi:hypothetical protein
MVLANPTHTATCVQRAGMPAPPDVRLHLLGGALPAWSAYVQRPPAGKRTYVDAVHHAPGIVVAPRGA